MSSFEIGGRKIGLDQPPYVIAELSANHNNRLDRAFEIVDVAAAAGASAIKLQTYTADSLTLDSDRADFRIDEGPWAGQTLHALYRQASTPWEWHEAIFRRARDRWLTIFSSAFDKDAVMKLVELGVPAFKVASFELVDIPLIEFIAATGKPLIMSTGLAELSEIEEAFRAARRAGCRSLALLHCISAYPAPIEEANLATIADLRRRFDVEAGLSDHTLGTTASVAAVALGATIIEKHVTMRRADGGPDAAFSLEPDELAELVRSCTAARNAIGTASYTRRPSEVQNLRFRRSLYAVADIPAGAALTEVNVRSIRPGFGLPPRFLPELMTRRAARTILRGEPLSWDMIEGGPDRGG